MMDDWNWHNISEGTSIEYTCAYCGREVAVAKGYNTPSSGMLEQSRHVRICHHCLNATYFDEFLQQYPAPAFGEPINKIAETDIGSLYDEARRAFSVDSFTAVVLCCRILLMHIAVDNGAAIGKTFVYYVDYLCDQNIVHQKARKWIDSIRDTGNIVNHEITLINRNKAEIILRFTEMLLKLAYEYPSIADDLIAK